jgi:hypothetical protein
MVYIEYMNMEKQVWLIVRDGKISDDIYTLEEAARHMACDGDHVVPYIIKIQNKSHER